MKYGVPIIIGASIYLISYGLAVLINKYRKKKNQVLKLMKGAYHEQ